MVSVNSSNELLQTIPVRPARPVASRNAQQEDQQNQIVEQATRQQNVVQDEDINRALLAYEQRNQQQNWRRNGCPGRPGAGCIPEWRS